MKYIFSLDRKADAVVGVLSFVAELEHNGLVLDRSILPPK